MPSTTSLQFDRLAPIYVKIMKTIEPRKFSEPDAYFILSSERNLTMKRSKSESEKNLRAFTCALMGVIVIYALTLSLVIKDKELGSELCELLLAAIIGV